MNVLSDVATAIAARICQKIRSFVQVFGGLKLALWKQDNFKKFSSSFVLKQLADSGNLTGSISLEFYIPPHWQSAEVAGQIYIHWYVARNLSRSKISLFNRETSFGDWEASVNLSRNHLSRHKSERRITAIRAIECSHILPIRENIHSLT